MTWSKSVDKGLARIPSYLRDKFMAWAMAVERVGMPEVRKLSSYHDEPLKGSRMGQRSIRLNNAYRAIYVELGGDEVRIIQVIEVSKHEY